MDVLPRRSPEEAANLDALVMRLVGPLSAAFAALLGWTAWQEWRDLPRETAVWVAGADAAVATVLAGVAIAGFSKRVPMRMAHPLAAVLALAITATHLISLGVQRNGEAVIQGAIIILGQGLVLLSMAWFVGILIVQSIAWTAVIVGRDVPVPGEFGFSLQVAIVLATALQWGRVRTFTAMERAQATERKQRAEAEAARDELALFANAVAHDLRSPLSAVRLKAAVLARHQDPKVAKAGVDLDRMMVASNDFIEGLLAYARSGQRIQRDWLDLAAVLDKAEELSNLDDPIDHDPLPTIIGDRALLQQLFLNLINNSVRYQHPDRALHLDVQYQPLDEGHQITFTDNGTGLDGVDLELIFEAFQRGSTAGGGHGLGLATCRRIAHAHNGSIKAEAVPNGARFVVVLGRLRPNLPDATAGDGEEEAADYDNGPSFPKHLRLPGHARPARPPQGSPDEEPASTPEHRTTHELGPSSSSST